MKIPMSRKNTRQIIMHSKKKIQKRRSHTWIACISFHFNSRTRWIVLNTRRIRMMSSYKNSNNEINASKHRCLNLFFINGIRLNEKGCAQRAMCIWFIWSVKNCDIASFICDVYIRNWNLCRQKKANALKLRRHTCSSSLFTYYSFVII